jgi:hypothetical protein
VAGVCGRSRRVSRTSQHPRPEAPAEGAEAQAIDVDHEARSREEIDALKRLRTRHIARKRNASLIIR